MNQNIGDGMHSTVEELHGLIDRQLDPSDHQRVTGHLQACPRCRSLYESLALFDSACKRVPLSTVAPGFTRSVLAALGVVPRTPLVFRLLEHAAYVFGLFVVAAIMTTVFVLTGVFTPNDAAAGKGPEAPLLHLLGSGFSDASTRFVGWLNEFLPFAFSHGALWVSAAALIVVLMIAVVDRSITRRMAKPLW